MRLVGYGEDRLVARLVKNLAAGADVRIGPGDDCAAIGSPRARHWQLLKTDCLVESVHFTSADDPRRVGWKALARNVSDIAAMGGLPRHALVTIAAPESMEIARLDRLYAGLKKCAARFGISIVGGETARSPGPLFISVALTGEVERIRCITRSGGKAGDALYVTGRLGGSLAGHHLDFIPRVEEARWLTEHFRIHAMMDLSDGLGSDLPRLARASGVGFTLDESRIPRTRGRTLAQALTDGEDYELLFALVSRASEKLERTWPSHFPKLTRIGQFTAEASSLPTGHDHFA